MTDHDTITEDAILDRLRPLYVMSAPDWTSNRDLVYRAMWAVDQPGLVDAATMPACTPDTAHLLADWLAENGVDAAYAARPEAQVPPCPDWCEFAAEGHPWIAEPDGSMYRDHQSAGYRVGEQAPSFRFEIAVAENVEPGGTPHYDGPPRIAMWGDDGGNFDADVARQLSAALARMAEQLDAITQKDGRS